VSRLVEKHGDFGARTSDCTEQHKRRTLRLARSRGRQGSRDDRGSGKRRFRRVARGGEQWALDRRPQVREGNLPQGGSAYRTGAFLGINAPQGRNDERGNTKVRELRDGVTAAGFTVVRFQTPT